MMFLDCRPLYRILSADKPRSQSANSRKICSLRVRFFLLYTGVVALFEKFVNGRIICSSKHECGTADACNNKRKTYRRSGSKIRIFKADGNKIGTTERIQSIVPMILSLEEVRANAALRSRSIPATPYSVSNGSFARNSYSFAFAPAEIKAGHRLRQAESRHKDRCRRQGFR